MEAKDALPAQGPWTGKIYRQEFKFPESADKSAPSTEELEDQKK